MYSPSTSSSRPWREESGGRDVVMARLSSVSCQRCVFLSIPPGASAAEGGAVPNGIIRSNFPAPRKYFVCGVTPKVSYQLTDTWQLTFNLHLSSCAAGDAAPAC